MNVWNVRELQEKAMEIIQEFGKTEMMMLVLTETREKGKGEAEMENVIYCCTVELRQNNGPRQA